MMEVTVFAAIGFLFAAYAVVGNDALQTLGTFIQSNSRLHWFWLFFFAATILVLTFVYGWMIHDGDPSWGRLSKADKYPWPEGGIQWFHVLPPLALVVITRLGVPVSTTFMVLTVFATVSGLTKMLSKSLIGYGLAFGVGLLVYLALSKTLEKYFEGNDLGDRAPYGLSSFMGIVVGGAIYVAPPLLVRLLGVEDFEPYWLSTAMTIVGLGVVMDLAALGLISWTGNQAVYWYILQWVTTGYLWAVWLIQDLANIFVFLPRSLGGVQCFTAMFAILGMLAYTFWNQGGPVQKILRSKTAVTDIRSATVIDSIYGLLLFFFKEVSNVPMSTTFVFLGLIAGREFGFAALDQSLSLIRTCQLALSDACKALIGLAVSIDLAVGLPRIAAKFAGNDMVEIGVGYTTFIITVNILLIPVAVYLRNQESKFWMFAAAGLLILGATLFFIAPPTR